MTCEESFIENYFIYRSSLSIDFRFILLQNIFVRPDEVIVHHPVKG
jgi:hypothetical protein